MPESDAQILPTRMHSLRRTSRKGKGQKFVGTCVLCGRRGLTAADMDAECENVRGLTQDESLVEAIKGDAGRAALEKEAGDE